MANILSIGFEYKGIFYKALARLKELGAKKEYHITVMNGELEKLLYGDHVLIESNGQLLLAHSISPGKDIADLIKAIATALEAYLKKGFVFWAIIQI